MMVSSALRDFEGTLDRMLIWEWQIRSRLRWYILLGPWWLRALDRDMPVEGGMRMGRARLIIQMGHRHRRVLQSNRPRRGVNGCMIIG